MSKIKDQIINLSLQLGFLLWLTQIGLLILSWKRLPPQVPLFYSRPWGEKQLVSPNVFWLLPAISLIITFVNLALASFVAKEEKFLSQLLVVFATIFNFLCFYTLLMIIKLIT